MECNKIKSLLSEYLDKTLQSDLNRDVKEHLLSCKECSNEFFLMKSISDQLSGMERLKAPNYLLNRVNKAVTSPSWYSKLFDFIPGSGGFKAPMEFATMATAAILVLLIFFNINIEKNENAI
ncbi:MAG: zf-HC2 domain-containing protein, partial [Deltaproteobacteria bacterium]|nr:zf-HC2 domain-containing protein [Deltaproteobacteria bacterium]